MKKLLLAAVAAMLLCAPMSASAQETDMAKLPCKEFLAADQAQIGILLAWIDGYMSAESENTMMSEEWMTKLGMHMAQYCKANPDKTIMDAKNAMPE